MSPRSATAMRVLHAAAEIFPYAKTGGLGDVLGALPKALAHTGIDVRLVLPAYPALREAVPKARKVASIGPSFGAATINILKGTLDGDLPVYLVDAPLLYERDGTPYLAPNGRDWPDNPRRFGLLSWAAAHLALGDLDRTWRADVLHAHDWHAGLAAAYRRQQPLALPRTVFTIHNLAFLGPFARSELGALMLPADTFAPDGLEFFGQGSFMKAGIFYSDALTTVSPTYAREIQTAEFGCRFEGLLRHRADVLHGILNGIDTEIWNPATDPHLPAHYDERSALDPRAGKPSCKTALQQELGLPADEKRLLIGVVSRLSPQKGIDLLAAAIPRLAADMQFAVLASGDAKLEARLEELVQQFPQAVAVRIAYSEALAHRIIAGADIIAVPSRYEPCGLTQLYGLRYGTLPLVRRVGGLADTVVDTNEKTLAAGTNTGFAFDADSPAALAEAALHAHRLRADAARWTATVQRAMRQDFSWDKAARQYRELYEALLGNGED
ncbi:MAG TPA: glycogen synthase GlgA [Burkholderiaceae bacterium]|nr:glycogen synthase GlgA [Burkholderiaceae bacterium]